MTTDKAKQILAGILMIALLMFITGALAVRASLYLFYKQMPNTLQRLDGQAVVKQKALEVKHSAPKKDYKSICVFCKTAPCYKRCVVDFSPINDPSIVEDVVRTMILEQADYCRQLFKDSHPDTVDTESPWTK